MPMNRDEVTVRHVGTLVEGKYVRTYSSNRLEARSLVEKPGTWRTKRCTREVDKYTFEWTYL